MSVVRSVIGEMTEVDHAAYQAILAQSGNRPAFVHLLGMLLQARMADTSQTGPLQLADVMAVMPQAIQPAPLGWMILGQRLPRTSRPPSAR